VLLAEAYPDLSRARIQRLIESGGVLLNGAPARKSARAEEGDTLALTLAPVAHPAPAGPGFELRILFEDELLLAVNKPAGLAVHGAPGDTGPSVANWFLARYPEAAAAFDAERPGIVHRLDKDTTGVLLLAKTPAAQAFVSHAFEARETTKTYLAIVEGVPARPRAVIDAPIGRHPGDRTRMAIVSRGREARTEYELLGSSEDRSLLLVHLYTGRTHQIRVHLAAIGHPVAEDVVYGSRETRMVARGAAGPKAGAALPARKSQLLHAWRLTVPHPGGGTLTATSPLPSDMGDVLRTMNLTALAQEYAAWVPATRDSRLAIHDSRLGDEAL
jgi:23S rRNA pseudouridine1911/1915/1917 synthase